MPKILIAEDDAGMLDVFSTAVESLGHCVIRATNGRVAWDIMTANPDTALLICDIDMPVMDGRALLMCMKADNRLCTVPVLAVSGVLRAREIAALLERGVTEFLAKPVRIGDLTAAVKRLTVEKRTRTERYGQDAGHVAQG